MYLTSIKYKNVQKETTTMTNLLNRILHPHHEGATTPVSTVEAAVKTAETEVAPTPQPEKLGNTTVTGAEIAATLVAPAAETVTPEASTDQPSDAEALATVEGAVNGPETFTVLATPQEVVSAAPFQTPQDVKPAAELQTPQVEVPATTPQSAEVDDHAATTDAIEEFEKDFNAAPVETTEPTTTEVAPIDAAVEEEDAVAAGGTNETIADNHGVPAKGQE